MQILANAVISYRININGWLCDHAHGKTKLILCLPFVYQYFWLCNPNQIIKLRNEIIINLFDWTYHHLSTFKTNFAKFNIPNKSTYNLLVWWILNLSWHLNIYEYINRCLMYTTIHALWYTFYMIKIDLFEIITYMLLTYLS